MFTVPQIAARLGVPVSRLSYVLMSRRIDAASVVGRTRLYREDQIETIRAALRGESRIIVPVAEHRG